MDGERGLIEEQIEYYRRRAREYDATSTPVDDPLAAEGDELRAALDRFAPSGSVLEIAAGTGTWTRELIAHASEVTAVDASPEMLELNLHKVRSDRVRYVVADVFSYEPDTRFDVVVFAFWLSHVPAGRFEAFWALVERSLKPSGRVFFIDEGRHERWDEDWVDRDAAIVRRPLLDGSQHRAVKVLWDPAELSQRLAGLGWEIEVRSTGSFYWGAGQRRPASSGVT